MCVCEWDLTFNPTLYFKMDKAGQLAEHSPVFPSVLKHPASAEVPLIAFLSHSVVLARLQNKHVYNLDPLHNSQSLSSLLPEPLPLDGSTNKYPRPSSRLYSITQRVLFTFGLAGNSRESPPI